MRQHHTFRVGCCARSVCNRCIVVILNGFAYLHELLAMLLQVLVALAFEFIERHLIALQLRIAEYDDTFECRQLLSNTAHLGQLIFRYENGFYIRMI